MSMTIARIYTKSISVKPSISTAILYLLSFLLLTWVRFAYIPLSYNWHLHFRPAAWRLFSGEPIYNAYFFNPPWALIPIAPLALLPEKLGEAIFGSLAIMVIAWAALKMGASKKLLALILLSPPVFYLYINVNLDWLPILGLFVPQWIGLFFLMVKPQVGLVIALVWLIRSVEEEGAKRTIIKFAPVTIAMLATISFWGGRILRNTNAIIDQSVNWGSWPDFIPVGIVLLFMAIRQRSDKIAGISYPFLSPYVAFYSLPLAILSLLPSFTRTAGAVVGITIWYLLAERSFLLSILGWIVEFF